MAEAHHPAAHHDELLKAVAAADEIGMPSLGTAFLVTWQWLQREEYIFTAFEACPDSK